MLLKSRFYFLIAMMATALCMVSCGDDDDDTPNLSPIVGTWNYSSHDYSWTINDQDFIPFLVENLNISEQEAQLFQALIETQVDEEMAFEGTSIIFSQDGKFSAREAGVEVGSGTYSLQNNNSVLVLTSDDGVQEFEVQELTNNKMVIAFAGEEQEDLTGDDQPEDIGFNLDVTFLK